MEQYNLINLLLAMIATYKDRSITLSPTLKAGIGIVYDIMGVDVPADKLSSLHEKGYLEQISLTSFPACKTCSDVSLVIDIKCPYCKSSSLSKIDLLTHYECGFAGSIEDFLKQNQKEYTCPKCRKTLKRVGIDYGRPGIGFKCLNCGEAFQFPLYYVKCSNNHITKLDEVELKSYPVYSIGDNLRSMRHLITIIERLKEILQNAGINSKIMVKIAGKSGAQHLIPLYITNSRNICIEFLTDGDNLINQFMQIIVKSLDLDAFFLVATYVDLDQKFTSVINPQRIKIVKVKSGEEHLTVASEVMSLI